MIHCPNEDCQEPCHPMSFVGIECEHQELGELLENGEYTITCYHCGCTAQRKEWTDDEQGHQDDPTEGIREVLAGDSFDLSVVGLGAGFQADDTGDEGSWM